MKSFTEEEPGPREEPKKTNFPLEEVTPFLLQYARYFQSLFIGNLKLAKNKLLVNVKNIKETLN